MGRSTRRTRCAPPPAGSAEQPRALLLLELGDLTADHRLRNIENGFHLRELAQLDDLGEVRGVEGVVVPQELQQVDVDRSDGLDPLRGEIAETGEREELAPMTPFERKIVHDAVAKVAGVSSESEGAEPSRRVVVLKD